MNHTMLKKLVSLLLAVSMVLSLAACGGNTPGTSTENRNGSEAQDPSGSGSETRGTDIADPTEGSVPGTESSGSETDPSGNDPSVPAGDLELTGVKKRPADGIGVPGTDFDEIDASSIGEWEEGWENTGFTVEYLAEDGFTPISEHFWGKEYQVRIEDEKLTKNWLLYQAREKGAVLYETAADKFLAFLEEDPETGWWYLADLEEGASTLHKYRIHIAQPGAEHVIPFDREELWTDNDYYFYTKNKPGKQYSVTVNFSETWDSIRKGFDLFARADYRFGGLSLEYDRPAENNNFNLMMEEYGISYTISPRAGQTVTYDGFLPFGEWTCWYVDRSNMEGETGCTVTLRVDEAADLTPIRSGEQLGMVKLIGTGGSCGAALSMPNGLSTYLPDWEYSLLYEPFPDNAGNYCFTVPAGYYSLQVGSDALGESNLRLMNVPVSSGRITEVVLGAESQTLLSDMMEENASTEKPVGTIGLNSVDYSDPKKTKITVTVFDPEDRTVLPQPEDFTVTENGVPGKVLEITQRTAAANIVLCIDTSGSMKNSMKDVIASATRFVQNLPDDASITILEYKQQIIEHPGTDKASAVAALKGMTATGDTSMYDALAWGLNYLEGKKNAFAVLFTDGIDSRDNPTDPAPGSSISKQELLNRVEMSEVTVFAIGFGQNHDAGAMQEIAGIRGEYFPATDAKALDRVFAEVTTKFGNSIDVVYERPTVTADTAGDTPVVTLMLDISGSMNKLPETGDDCDIRMNRVRTLFHDFFTDLPAGSLMQLGTFADASIIDVCTMMRQILTDDKASLLAALSEAQALGGTPTLEALRMGYSSLRGVSSSKRVLIFFTDAGLEVEEDKNSEFEETLAQFKEAGIRVLFAGLGTEDYAVRYDGLFQHAAELAGGDYIIESSVEQVQTKLDEVLASIDKPGEVKEDVSLSIALDTMTDQGSRMTYAMTRSVEGMKLLTKQGKAVEPGRIILRDGGAYVTYSPDTAALLYGGDDRNETLIDQHISFAEAAVSNDFADMTVRDAYFMSSFKGISHDFLALNLTLTFHKKNPSAKETGYQIPNIFNHFYVSVNNGRMMPASEATWLAETPLAVPGECMLQVNELYNEKHEPLELGESVSGVLVFAIDSLGKCEQLSLHMYDTSYGHLQCALVGKMPQNLLEMTALPTAEPEKLSDAFSISLTGRTDTDNLQGAELPREDDENKKVGFRVVEAQFDSRVQALLDIDPLQRFYYKLPSNSGDLLIPMDPIVGNLPLGFTGATKLAPGSSQNVRLPYAIPVKMSENEASVWADLQSGSCEMNVQKGSPYSSKSEGLRFEHEYFTLIINEFAYTSEDRREAALDFTVIDKKDGEGTAGFDTALYLFREVEGLETGGNNGSTIMMGVSAKGLGNFGDLSDVLEPVGVLMADLGATRELIFGASAEDRDWGAYDGMSRRGILIFSVNDDARKDDWRLSCELLPELSLAISDSLFSDTALLARKPYVSVDTSFREMLMKKVDAAVAAYRATHPSSDVSESVGLTDDEIIGRHVETPYLTVYGTQQIEAVKTEEDFKALMNSLTWLPCGRSECSIFAPEAVVTQGFGSDGDFYYLTKALLGRLGYASSLRIFRINETGWENLQRWGGFVSYEKPEYLYALAYTDAKGNPHIYVPALRHEADELYGLGTVAPAYVGEPAIRNVRVTVTASGKLTESAAMAQQMLAMMDIGSILGGGEGGAGYYETVKLLEAEISLHDLSRNPVDLSFVSLGKDDDGVHDKITAVLDTPAGLFYDGAMWASSASYDFDRIDVSLESSFFTNDMAKHTYILQEGDSLLDIFKSISVNMPEMTEQAAAAYEAAVRENAKAAETLDTDYGTGRWITHAALARMAYTLTGTAAEIRETLGLAPCVDGLLAACATLKSDGKDAIGSFDLIDISRGLLLTEKTEQEGGSLEELRKSFNQAFSMRACTAEGSVYPTEGACYVDVWASMPESSGFVNVDTDSDEKERAAAYFESLGAPAYMLERLRDQSDYYTAFVLPTAPGSLYGRECWCWLEIDTYSMKTVSVFDTGERSMASYIIGLTPKNAVEFTAGALIGLACSNFSVASYALTTDDTEEIMYNAALLTAYTLCCLKGFKSLQDDLVKAVTDPLGSIMGQISDAAKSQANDAFKNKTGIDIMAAYDAIKEAGEGKEPNFISGFEEVMNMYFGLNK